MEKAIIKQCLCSFDDVSEVIEAYIEHKYTPVKLDNVLNQDQKEVIIQLEKIAIRKKIDQLNSDLQELENY